MRNSPVWSTPSTQSVTLTEPAIRIVAIDAAPTAADKKEREDTLPAEVSASHLLCLSPHLFHSIALVEDSMTKVTLSDSGTDYTASSADAVDDRYTDIRYGEDEIPPSIYFGGCSFGAGFYVGVYMAMVEKWGPGFHKKVLWSGGSAGTVFAVGLALGKDVEEMNHLYKTVADRSNRHGAVYYASIFMEEATRELLSDPLAYKLLEGHCCIGTTAFFDKHRWHNNFGLKGTLVVDGAYGFAGEDLPHGDHTLFVGIDPHAEITRTFANDEMMYPPVGEAYEEMVRSGYLAFKQWDGRMLRKVGRRRPNYPALYVLWVLKVFEFLYHCLMALVRALLRVLHCLLMGGKSPSLNAEKT
eukprot:gene8683-9566_t